MKDQYSSYKKIAAPSPLLASRGPAHAFNSRIPPPLTRASPDTGRARECLEPPDAAGAHESPGVLFPFQSNLFARHLCDNEGSQSPEPAGVLVRIQPQRVES
ncbi:unnamed protein product [Clonostachys byssicola]|uniref:Uncharacterized protein n=1 Tax=Clonostachys byssicola TaxID=160290 RepID=A0A9N9ULF6_9HYPO|nr:unnamed protein product [Clonostachys byssicola]